MTTPVPTESDPGGSPPPGSAERLHRAFRPHGDPVFVLHGPGVNDAFACQDFLERGVEEAIWAELRAAGYARIVYVNATEMVYYRDPVSAGEAPPEAGQHAPGATRVGAAAAAGPGLGTVRMRRFSGPQGNRMRFGGPAAGGRRQVSVQASATARASVSDGGLTTSAEAGARVSNTATRTRMTDDYAVQMINHHLTQRAVRTAIVIVRAEQVLAHFTGPTARILAESFGVWLSGGQRTDNLCVLLFSQPDRASLVDDVRRLGVFTVLADWLQDQARTGRAFGLVGPPLPAEMERAVHLLRLRRGLRVTDWPGLARLAAAMAAEPATGVQQWLTLLTGWAEAGRPLDGRALARAGHLSGSPDGRTAWERLDALTGLESVKAHVRRLADRAAMVRARPTQDGRAPEADALHLIFTGGPGTGKTTVARLIGEIYRDIGVLTRGHLVAPELAELVSDVVGGTARAVNAQVDQALDGVLFVDEAYRLTDRGDEFGTEAVNQLLTRMENDRDRLVVIAAGYTEEMERFLRANPGLPRRFPRTNIIHFPDYSVDELLEILFSNLGTRGLSWAPQTADALREVVSGLHRNRGPQFGNAGDMRTLAGDLEGAWATRVSTEARRHVEDDDPGAGRLSLIKSAEPSPGGPRSGSAADLWGEPLSPEDIPEPYRVHLSTSVPRIDEVLAEIDGLTGLGAVRDQIRGLHAQLRFRQRIGGAGVVAPHLLFVGPPGTGKTTVARIVGRMFHALGLLARDEVVETDRSGLVAEYLGQTEAKTRAVIERARGGVLFIDEAYALTPRGPQDYGREVIDTLVPAMENLRGQLVVIAAGYPDAMEEFLRANDGLPSRFTQRVEFPNYSDDDLVTIFENMAQAEGYRVDPAARAPLAAWFRLRKTADPRTFANARTARGLLGEVETRHIARVGHLPEGTDHAVLTTIIGADIPVLPG